MTSTLPPEAGVDPTPPVPHDPLAEMLAGEAHLPRPAFEAALRNRVIELPSTAGHWILRPPGRTPIYLPILPTASALLSVGLAMLIAGWFLLDFAPSNTGQNESASTTPLLKLVPAATPAVQDDADERSDTDEAGASTTGDPDPSSGDATASDGPTEDPDAQPSGDEAVVATATVDAPAAVPSATLPVPVPASPTVAVPAPTVDDPPQAPPPRDPGKNDKNTATPTAEPTAVPTEGLRPPPPPLDTQTPPPLPPDLPTVPPPVLPTPTVP